MGRPEFLTGSPEDPRNSRYGTKAGFGPATRPLNRIIYPDQFADALAGGKLDRQQGLADTKLELDLYRCPSDTGYTGMHCPDFRDSGLSSFDHFGTSYNANIFMIRYPRPTWFPGPSYIEISSNSPYLHRLKDLRAPARTLAFQENCGRFAWMAGPLQPECHFPRYGLPDTSRGWHGKDWTFNAAFIDGHADTIYMRGYRMEQTDPYASLHCERVRGEGWQVDVLPVTPAHSLMKYSEYDRPSYEDCFDAN